jgi:hypothetical protein
VPRYIELLEDLPRTENGIEVLKYLLRERGVTVRPPGTAGDEAARIPSCPLSPAWRRERVGVRCPPQPPQTPIPSPAFSRKREKVAKAAIALALSVAAELQRPAAGGHGRVP